MCSSQLPGPSPRVTPLLTSPNGVSVSLFCSAPFFVFICTNANRQPPFDVDDPEVQRACRAVARLLLGDAGEEEARRTIVLEMIARDW